MVDLKRGRPRGLDDPGLFFPTHRTHYVSYV